MIIGEALRTHCKVLWRKGENESSALSDDRLSIRKMKIIWDKNNCIID